MAIKYYYSVNGELHGPFSKEELSDKPITAETLVWIEGMPSWLPAGEVPMFADILDGSYVPEQSAPDVNRAFNTSMSSSSAIPGAPRPSRVQINTSQPPTEPSGMPYHQASPYAPKQETYTPGVPQSSPYTSEPIAPPTAPQYNTPDAKGTYNLPPGTTNPQPGYGSVPGYGPQQQYDQQQYGQQYGQPQYGPQPQFGTPQYGGPQYVPTPMGDMPSKQYGWTVTGTCLNGLSLLSLFMGGIPFLLCIIPLILGIIGISKGSNVENLWRSHQFDAARQASQQAKTLGMWSVFIYVGVTIVCILLVLLGVGLILGAASLGSDYGSDW